MMEFFQTLANANNDILAEASIIIQAIWPLSLIIAFIVTYYEHSHRDE